VRDSLALLQAEGSLRRHLDRLVGFDDFTELVGLAGLAADEDRFRT
jgi:hypothetical protein